MRGQLALRAALELYVIGGVARALSIVAVTERPSVNRSGNGKS
jgi:hypothetical protein